MLMIILEIYCEKVRFLFDRMKKDIIFAPAFRHPDSYRDLMRHSRRNGRVVECGSLENC